MATITLTIPNPVANRVMDAISTKYGYSSTMPDGSVNPQSKAEFTKAWIISMLKNAVKEHEGHVASLAAATNASNDVDTNISIT